MFNIKNKTGERYGRLVVIEYYGKNEKGRILWRCKCDCGNEKIVASDLLSSGKTKSCGCLKYEVLHNPNHLFKREQDRKKSIMKVQYSHIKRRNKKFTGEVMTFEEFCKKSEEPCAYCGEPYSKEIEDRLNETKNGKRLSSKIVRINGIDRINSSIGYTNENTVACCKKCNTAKNTMSKEDFLSWIYKVYHFNNNE